MACPVKVTKKLNKQFDTPKEAEEHFLMDSHAPTDDKPPQTSTSPPTTEMSMLQVHTGMYI